MKKLLSILLILVSTSLYAADKDFDTKAGEALKQHFNKYKALEYFSAIQVSIYVPNQELHNYQIGKMSHATDSPDINANTLFNIGSITKSFTSVLILQLEKAKKLSITQPLAVFLPQYSKWGNITIESLLNMTSNIPNYSDSPTMNAAITKQMRRGFSYQELINIAYPPQQFDPPRKVGYFYSNTGYILAGMIVEKLTKQPFAQVLQEKIIKPAKLTNTFYLKTTRIGDLAHGYAFNMYENPELVGQDMRDNNLSWAGPAGGIIANTQDIIKWVNTLYNTDLVIDSDQRLKLSQLVSLDTGKRVSDTTAKDSRTFGLGVAQMYDPELSGRFWFYEGQTLGYRAVFIYQPCNGVIISTIFNSATNNENDHAHLLLKGLYEITLKNNPNLVCKK